VALIADEVCEAARDGRTYAEVEALGYEVLYERDVLPGVADAVGTVEVEPLFPDGHRLVVLHDPIRAVEPPPPRVVEPAWLPEATEELVLRNAGEVPVGITSHFHLFEVNRALDFPRAGAWGCGWRRPGVKVVVAAGEERTVRMVPIAGRRVVRGHGGWSTGRSTPRAPWRPRLQRARERGYRGA
jgi:urease subunit gamma/beta